MIVEYENLGKLNESFVNDYKKSFEETLNSGWYILNNQVIDFEKEFATYCDTRYCVGLASGLDALILALKYFDFPPGSEVIVPSNTYIATIIAILQCGLTPVLVEPDIRTYNINHQEIEGKITIKTRVIMVVHLYGKMCDMNPILSLSSKYSLKIIEDCAQAHGATYMGKKAGSFGSFGAFSFYPTKNLGALGDAGAITTNITDKVKKIRALRNYGSNEKYINQYLGFNSRLDAVQAGFLSVKLKRLEEINDHKNKLAAIYNIGLKESFIKPIIQEGYGDVYHIYAIRHPERDKLREYLIRCGIKTEIHYPVPPYKQKALDGVFVNDYPISDEIHRTILSLPISFSHTVDEIEYVTDCLNKF